jgi:hypothetical protein
VFDESRGKGKTMPDSKYVRELRVLLNKQRRWMTRIKRAMTAISKIERQIKRLDAVK